MAMSQRHSNFANIAPICERYGNDPSALIEILHDIQSDLGCVPEEALEPLAEILNLSHAEVHGVKSFYDDFTDLPAQGVRVHICQAEACKSTGSKALENHIRARFEITDVPGTNPSPATLSIRSVYCLGNCALSPAATINGELYGRLTQSRLTALLNKELA